MFSAQFFSADCGEALAAVMYKQQLPRQNTSQSELRVYQVYSSKWKALAGISTKYEDIIQ
jgi:hypothetical protein